MNIDEDRPMTTAELPDAGELGGVMTRGDKVFYRILRVLLNGVMKVYFRHKVVGRHNIPKSGGFILCPVHRSYLDTPIVTVITPRIMRFMGGEKFFSNAFARWFLNAMGGFPVERSAADRGAIAIAQSILERGEPLVMFPEGTRRDGPVVLPENMRDGPAFVAGRAQVPIVPIGIGGSARALPRSAKFVFPRKLAFVIGAPIPPPAKVNGRVPRKAVARQTEVLRDELQRLYDEAQALAK